MPFTGVVELNIAATSYIPTPLDCLALVVADTSYNAKVPVVIGTNFLRRMDTSHMDGQHQGSAWQFALTTLQDKEKFFGPDGKIATVQSTNKRPLTVGANQTTIVWGSIPCSRNVGGFSAFTQQMAHGNMSGSCMIRSDSKGI